MFGKLLVANRGEIAIRVMAACEELGIDTVAVYSDADRHGGHVEYADEAYNVGPPPASESYLDGEAIVETAKLADADAIHPGYGFLAENADFARRVEAADGITWIGPGSDTMERLGEKTTARTVMSEAGVPVVPGTTDPVETAGEVADLGEEFGYPIAIKAEGGGGGRGMKIVHDAAEVEDAFEAAQREGEAYFDNDSVYVEKYLDAPKHIEVQILADDTATSATSANGTARCSAATRKSSRRPRVPRSPTTSARRSARPPDRASATPATPTPAPSSSSSRTGSFTSWRSTRGSRSNTPSPRK